MTTRIPKQRQMATSAPNGMGDMIDELTDWRGLHVAALKAPVPPALLSHRQLLEGEFWRHERRDNMKRGMHRFLLVILFVSILMGCTTADIGRLQVQNIAVEAGRGSGGPGGNMAHPSRSPALWKIDGPEGDVYLFGSIHFLPQGLNWRPPALDTALREAQVVVFELNLDDEQNLAAMQQLTSTSRVLLEGETLRELLTPEQRAKYERVAASIGMPAPRLDRVRPWFAAFTMGLQWIVSQGYDPHAGVDQQIWNWSEQNGKTLAALETVEEQLGAFAGLSREEGIEYLSITLDQIEHMPTMLDDLVRAWHHGDTVQLDALLNAAMEDLPALSQRLLNNRNAEWLPEIERMMADGRTHVIVVGAAHLVGEDSVIAMLRAKGIKVEGP